MKQYPCPKAESEVCRHGGNKYYNYGFCQGTASYCRLANRWVSDLKECPLIEEYGTGYGDTSRAGQDRGEDG